MKPFTFDRRRALAWLGASSSALVLGLAPATAGAVALVGWDEAQAIFLKAAGGDEAAIEPAAERTAKLAAAHPGDAVLMAYAGAAETMRARTTMLPWRKMRHADDGLAQLDKALALVGSSGEGLGPDGVPAVLSVRLVAANTFLALPGMFNRQERGEKLLAELPAHRLFAGTPLAFRGSVWMRSAQAARAAKRLPEARQALQAVIDAGAPQAAAARAQLQELGR